MNWTRAQDLARWTAASARQNLDDPAVLDQLLDVGILAIDFPSNPPASLSDRALTVLRRCSCVTVALTDLRYCAPALDAFDVVLGRDELDGALAGGVGTSEHTLDLLVERVRAAPAASRVLAHVLRSGEALGPLDRLTLESLSYSLLLASPAFADWLRSRKSYDTRPDDGAPVLVHRDGNSLTITLNRPHVHNAYNAALRDALVDALRLVNADPDLSRVVLDGAGPSFCSGGDLTEFGATRDVAYAHALRLTRNAAAELYPVRDRVEARVHGACIGAGVELASFCRRVVADPGTKFRLPEVAMGLLPGAGGTVSLGLRVGRQRAMLFALAGATIDAQTALRLGLIDAIEPVLPAAG